MKKRACALENVLKRGVGIFLLIIALGFFLSGIRDLPIIGMLLALPPFATAYMFLAAPPSKTCALF
jgi:hypothetical protein